VPDVGNENSPEGGNKDITEGSELGPEFVAGISDGHWIPNNEARASTGLPPQTTKCPAKQVVRTVQRKAGEMGKFAAGWARQHFPQLLSGPLGGFITSRPLQLASVG